MKRVRRRNPTPFFFFSLKTVRISNNLATLSLSLLITLNVAASIQQALYTNNTTETELSPNGASIAFAKTSSGADPDQTSAAFLRTFANEISHLVRTFLKTSIFYSIPKALCRVYNGAGNFGSDILGFCNFL